MTLFEMLEARRLFAAVGDTNSAVIDDTGKLVVTGSAHSDTISLGIDSSDNSKLDVMINGVQAGQFDLSAITNGIEVVALNGNDRIGVDESNGALALSVTMFGGNGKDIMYGGSEDDSIQGNNGPDRIWAGAGNDNLDGGNGKDAMFGEDGDDFLFGGHGKDKVDGGDGDDDVRGGDNHDTLRGGHGNDDFSAQDANRELKDGSSSDHGDNDLDDLLDEHELA
jgi:Ca2+-binding RTX toxin-like protein